MGMVTRKNIPAGAADSLRDGKWPLLTVCVTAGFPSPAEDYIDRRLDLNEYLIHHPAATFFMRVRGESMIGAGIRDGDLVIVDRAVAAEPGDIVVASVLGELTLKRIRRRGGKCLLVAANDAYPPLDVPVEADVEIWGVCKHAIHSF